MTTESKTIVLGDIDGAIETPFVLKFSVARSGEQLAGSTNVFADTCAAELGVQPDALPASEKVGTTGSSMGGETGDTTFDAM